MDAVRFCHAAQMLLMYAQWPPEAADFYGLSVPSPDGRWIFQGPRVAMAVHVSGDFNVSSTRLLGICIVAMSVGGEHEDMCEASTYGFRLHH